MLATETGNFDSHLQLSYSSFASPKPFSPVSQHPAVNGDSIGLAVHVLVVMGFVCCDTSPDLLQARFALAGPLCSAHKRAVFRFAPVVSESCL